MYINMYLYTERYIYIYMYMYIHMHICRCAFTYIHMFVCIYLYRHIVAYAFIAGTHTRMLICICSNTCGSQQQETRPQPHGLEMQISSCMGRRPQGASRGFSCLPKTQNWTLLVSPIWEGHTLSIYIYIQYVCIYILYYVMIYIYICIYQLYVYIHIGSSASRPRQSNLEVEKSLL